MNYVCRKRKIQLTFSMTSYTIYAEKINRNLRGGVKFPTGGYAAFADKPASQKILFLVDFGVIPKPTV